MSKKLGYVINPYTSNKDKARASMREITLDDLNWYKEYLKDAEKEIPGLFADNVRDDIIMMGGDGCIIVTGDNDLVWSEELYGKVCGKFITDNDSYDEEELKWYYELLDMVEKKILEDEKKN